MRSVLLVMVASSLVLSCGPATAFPEPIYADDARNNDAWIEAERCTPGISDQVGLSLEDLTPGSGRAVGPGDTVRVHYTAAASESSALLHNSRNSGAPFEIIIGSTKVPCGFEKALIGMHPGGRRRAKVPWILAFGDAGRPPDVAPRTDLVFVIDLYLPATSTPSGGTPPVNPAGRGAGGGRRR